MIMMNQDAVIATNDDASQCKRFAVDKGYWDDHFISLFVAKNRASHTPEIQKGYYARVTSIRRLIDQFLKLVGGNSQIVNLGAGFDTTYWSLKEQKLSPGKYVELDFPVVTKRKCQIIRNRKPLFEKLITEDGDIAWSEAEIHAGDYHLISADLQNIHEVENKLNESDVSYHLPTLFIAECVLVYIDATCTDCLLKWISDKFSTAMFINYEQVNICDRFGDIMIVNLKNRNCHLMGISACTSLDSQKERFKKQNWTEVSVLTMLDVYKRLPQADVQRIEMLEFLDERELLDQLLCHYCLAWAFRDGAKVGLASITV